MIMTEIIGKFALNVKLLDAYLLATAYLERNNKSNDQGKTFSLILDVKNKKNGNFAPRIREIEL